MRTVAINSHRLNIFIKFNMLDCLAAETQNLAGDTNAHLSVIYKVVRDFIFQQVSVALVSFFTHKSGEEPYCLMGMVE